MIRHFLIPVFLLFAINIAHAQMPPICPSDNTPAADLCEDMCIYCNLQAYIGTTAGYTGQSPANFCGTIENEQWLGFVAGATGATISAVPSNCQIGDGIQVALYTDCFSDPVPGGCNGGFAGGGNTPISITVSLTPGQVYYLMIDAYAGDICDFSVTVSPPGAALNGQVIAEEIGLCPGETFIYNGVEYSAPGVVTDTLSSQSGDCDTILLFNLVALTFITDTQTVKFCPGDTVVIGDDFFTEPGTFVLQIPSITGGCDTLLTYALEYLPQPTTTQTIVLQPLEPVVISGNVYFAPDTVQGTLPSASGGCDTAVTYILVLDLSVSDTCAKTISFLKLLGQPLSSDIGQVILPASDGNFYLAGQKNAESFIMKVTPNGAVLWTRTFQPAPPLTTAITDLIEDSDGMLAGCGTVSPNDISTKGCAFRFNPSTGNLMWVKLLQQESPEAFTIVEKNPGGNFLLLTSPQLTINVDDAEMWELDRNTGALLGGLTRRYNYGISDVYSSMVVHDGAIYAVGRHIPGFPNPPIPLDKMRVGLTKFDLATGAPIWSRLSHLDANAFASLSGQDLLIEEEGDSAVLIVYNGSDVADFGNQSAFFLQKTTLDGDLLWVKKYKVPGLANTEANDIQRMSDGYIITGQAYFNLSGWNKIVVKTDFDGNVLWAKSVTNSGIFGAGSSAYNPGQHQSAVVNDVYYLAGLSEDVPTDVLFLKMTSDGAVSDSCGFVESVNVQAEVIQNLVNLPIQLTFNQFLGQLINAPPATDSTEMSVSTFCVSCLLDCDDTLDLGPDIILCKDSTLTFNAGSDFVSYLWQDGSTDSTFTTNVPDIYWVEVTNECGDKQRDSVLLSVSLAGDIKLPDSTICIGESLTYTVQDFDTYLWSPATGLSCSTCATVTIQPGATTTYALYAENAAGCSKTDTFTVVVLPLQTRTETVEFCPGESVVIGGSTYTQPGTVVDTIPASVGCDTIATYILKFIDTPGSSVSIDCPDNIDIPTNPGTGPIVVNYNLPVATSDCECPGISLALTQGLPPGSLFPVTTTQVCYEAKDSCGNKASCCFAVTVREEQPCDVKTIGCMKYELLTITRGSTSKNLTYRIRATNTCANKMIYTAIQLPDGLTAVSPANNSVFTAESGRKYDVRNPNYSPFYSIRFKSQVDSIAGGQSDIFEYTLPPQINPNYIHVTSRLYPQIFQEAFLNTFNCPIETVQDKPENRQDSTAFRKLETFGKLGFSIFPNPTSGALFADFSDWQGEQLQVQIFSSQGQRVQLLSVQASDTPQEVALPEGLSSGIYFLEVLRENGEKWALRFVVQR